MKSVFVINGFLDSGKTQFISYTLAQPYFQQKGTTLLIQCEEGEEEYDPALLAKTQTVLATVEDPSEITPEKLVEFDKKYKPARIVIEYNGMWNYKEFKLPFMWKLEQQITLINATNFELYYNNMRSLFAEMLRKSELVIVNRCDGLTDKVATFKRNIKVLNQTAEIVFEDKEGEINATLEEELPYDISKDTITLTDDTYGTWYIDVNENLDRYIGKKIDFIANALVPGEVAKGMFVPGRMVMTCCVEDIQFLGFPCKYDKASDIPNKSWVHVVATVGKEYFEGYKGLGPVLIAESVSATKTPKNEVITF